MRCRVDWFLRVLEIVSDRVPGQMTHSAAAQSLVYVCGSCLKLLHLFAPGLGFTCSRLCMGYVLFLLYAAAADIAGFRNPSHNLNHALS